MKRYCSITLLFGFLAFQSCKTTAPISADTRAQLQAHLSEMATMDQVAMMKKVTEEKYKAYTDEQWKSLQDSVFEANKRHIEAYFSTYGYLGYAEVGEESSNSFWMITQHADHDPAFQRKVLRAMKKELKQQNANPENYAYLFDRAQVNAGKKQLFGTQVDYLKGTGKAPRVVPKIGLIDSANVDKRRKAHNLKPLKEYLNMITEWHFQLNKENYLKQGITKPDLY